MLSIIAQRLGMYEYFGTSGGMHSLKRDHYIMPEL